MPRLLRLCLLAALCLGPVAVPSTPASAATFTGEVLDASGEVVRLSDVELARDGTGVAAWTRREAGVEHVFVSRFLDGAWQPAERLDVGLADPGTQPAVAAADGGLAIVAWTTNSTVVTSIRQPAATTWGAPTALAPGDSPDVDVSISGAAYAVWHDPQDDIRAARLDRGAPAFVPIAQPLDLLQSAPAGNRAGRRPEVAIAADGTALATWAEENADGRLHVIARRLFGANVSVAPRDLTLNDFQGRAAGDADAPQVEVQDDSSFAWVSFRQTIDGRLRVVSRRLVGGDFDPAFLPDGLGLPTTVSAGLPAFDLNGTGEGLVATRRAEGSVALGILENRKFDVQRRVDVTGAFDVPPFVARSQNKDGLVGWLTDSGQLVGRHYDGEDLGLEEALSNPALGTIDPESPILAASDRAGGFAVLAVQGGKIVATMLDRLPGRFSAYTTTRSRNVLRPKLSWRKSFDLWGPLTYAVTLDGVFKGATATRGMSLADDLSEGEHRWQVTAIDRRGQRRAFSPRAIRVDVTPPVAEVKQKGSRALGKVLLVEVEALDPANAGSAGISRVRIDWGDGSKPRVRRSNESVSGHRYKRRGRYEVSVSVTDAAGNENVTPLTVTVRRAR